MTRTRTWLTTAVCSAPFELRAHLENVQDSNSCSAQLVGFGTAPGPSSSWLPQRQVTGRTGRPAHLSARRWPNLAC